MGCFFACFGPVDGKRRKSRNKSLPRDLSRRNCEPAKLSSPVEKDLDKKQTVCEPDIRAKAENLSFTTRRKVTFDLNVNAYIEVKTTGVQISSDVEEEKERKIGDQKVEKQNEASVPRNDSTQPNPVSFPANHRYQNCVISNEEDDDEEEDGEEEDEIEYGDSDYEEDDVVEKFHEPCLSSTLESQEILSTSFETNREVICSRQTSAANGIRDRSHYVNSVLNPVENLSQWKAVKARPVPQSPKEDHIDSREAVQIPLTSEEAAFKSPKSKTNFQLEPKENFSSLLEIPVDASLSNWSAPGETTPATKQVFFGTGSQTSNSPKKYADRPILGASTVEEMRRSASSSPRSPPSSRKPHETPILSTVESHWSHQDMDGESKGIPNTTSKYREDKKVKWHATPFEVRLQRALSHGAAAAY